jgi:hypothetical protein
MHVALVTWQELPGLSDDDQELLGPLRELGVEATAAVWNDPGVRWGEFDAVVIRSTWDYYRRIAEFRSWIDRVGAGDRLWNPAGVVRWNSHKSYLRDLEDRGVPIIPTRFCPDLASAARALEEEGWDRAVLKPAVSAAAYRTHVITPDSIADGSDRWKEVAAAGELLLQPYQDEVERSGERSLVFFWGNYSHTYLRAPRLARSSTLIEGTAYEPREDEIRVARLALACAPGRTLYGRVDLLPDEQGRMRVMELEVIEPRLGLSSSPGSAQRFAEAIRDAV